MNKVLGVGWAKTGTKTLGACLRTLGYRHRSTRLDLARYLWSGETDAILDVARPFDSFEDWPWLLLFREFDARFPNSKFILTTRDDASWLASYHNMLRLQGPPSAELLERRRILYGLPFPDVTDEQLLQRRHRHEAEVRRWFAGRGNDLLVVDWSKGDGWKELCGFLGHAIPGVDFPHANKAEYSGRGS